MERENYNILTERYAGMQGRFVQGKGIVWLVLLVHAVLLFACIDLAEVSGKGTWIIWCRCYSIGALLIVIATNLKLLFYKRFGFTARDMAFYCLVNIGGFMLSLTFVFVGGVAYDSLEIALLALALNCIICAGFWIAVARYNNKKLQEGGFCWKTRKLEKTWKLWLWGVTAIPILPFLGVVGRRIWFNTLGEITQTLLFMYALLWFWLVLIYTLFAPSALFMRLEEK